MEIVVECFLKLYSEVLILCKQKQPSYRERKKQETSQRGLEASLR